MQNVHKRTIYYGKENLQPLVAALIVWNTVKAGFTHPYEENEYSTNAGVP